MNRTHYEATQPSADDSHMNNLAAQGAVFLALESGVDERMPSVGSPRRYRLSSYLGECSEEAQGLLFQAACLAMTDASPLGMAMRHYLDRVAQDYADDHHEAFE